MKLGLPRFNPSAEQREWVENEIETARLIRIRALWDGAGRKRRDPGFVSLLVQCGWTNVGKDGCFLEATRAWRNKKIAGYLHVPYTPDKESDKQLARELASAFPRLRRTDTLVGVHTGISHYYKALRPATLAFVDAHAAPISEAFKLAASERLDTAVKIEWSVNLILSLGPIKVHGAEISPLNGLTPTLACLDPDRRVPIMNAQTRSLLRVLRLGLDTDGALAYSKLIGSHGIRNSFELDVYSETVDFKSVPKPSRFKPHSGQFRILWAEIGKRHFCKYCSQQAQDPEAA